MWKRYAELKSISWGTSTRKTVQSIDVRRQQNLQGSERALTRSNGITEGFHNKMETLSRQAYGFRNFENYRLRVKVLCS